MNKNDTHAFINQLLVCTLVMICFSGSIGLGTVWLRHQISITANSTKRIESTLAEVERRKAELDALISIEESSESLDRKNTAMRIGLVPKRDTHVVWIGESPERRLAELRNREIFAGESFRPSPVLVSFAGAGTR